MNNLTGIFALECSETTLTIVHQSPERLDERHYELLSPSIFKHDQIHLLFSERHGRQRHLVFGLGMEAQICLPSRGVCRRHPVVIAQKNEGKERDVIVLNLQLKQI